MTPDDIDYYLNMNHDLQDLKLYDDKAGGLGLILSRNFTEKIRGKLTIESKLDEGTLVKLSVPKA